MHTSAILEHVEGEYKIVSLELITAISTVTHAPQVHKSLTACFKHGASLDCFVRILCELAVPNTQSLFGAVTTVNNVIILIQQLLAS